MCVRNLMSKLHCVNVMIFRKLYFQLIFFCFYILLIHNYFKELIPFKTMDKKYLKEVVHGKYICSKLVYT